MHQLGCTESMCTNSTLHQVGMHQLVAPSRHASSQLHKLVTPPSLLSHYHLGENFIRKLFTFFYRKIECSFMDFFKYFSNPFEPIEGYTIAALSAIIYVLLLLRVKCYEQCANGPTNSLFTLFLSLGLSIINIDGYIYFEAYIGGWSFRPDIIAEKFCLYFYFVANIFLICTKRFPQKMIF